MRLLHVTHRFLPHYLAGTEVYAATLCRELAARGHDIKVFTGNSSAADVYAYEWARLPVQAVPWGMGQPSPLATFLGVFFNPRAEHVFAQLCTSFKPDLVHIHHLMGLSPRLPAIARAHGAHVIITLHDYWWVCSNTWLFRWDRLTCPGPGWGYYCGGCALHRLGRAPQLGLMALAALIFVWRTRILRRALQAADQLIAPWASLARILTRLSIPQELIKVIPHGLSEVTSVLRSKGERPIGPLTFVYLGSLIPPKGVHVALAAFCHLVAPEAQFHVYGDLEADPGYVAELRRLAKHPGIKFMGKVERSAVDEALQAADVAVVPSLWPEPYGIVLDEAQAVGLPVVASDLGALPERIMPEVNGLIVPAGNVAAWTAQMQRLVDDPTLLARLQQGVTPPKRLAQHVAELEAVYVEVLAR